MTLDFKKQAADFILETSNQHILSNFDKNDKMNRTIKINIDTTSLELRRNCFPGRTSTEDYYEDYHVTCVMIIENQILHSAFYLEWNSTNTALQLAVCNKKIKINKCKQETKKRR